MERKTEGVEVSLGSDRDGSQLDPAVFYADKDVSGVDVRRSSPFQVEWAILGND